MKPALFTFTVAVAVALLFSFASAIPLPQSPAIPPPKSPAPPSAVVLKLNDGRAARCTLPSEPSRTKADLVGSRLIASGKAACSTTLEHVMGGKTLVCVSGQLDSVEAVHTVFKDACKEHAGVHSVH